MLSLGELSTPENLYIEALTPGPQDVTIWRQGLEKSQSVKMRSLE